MRVVVIGGGASGLVASIHAKDKKNEVLLLERNSKCCKKLLLTGNGRCNYYNEKQSTEYYHSDTSWLLKEIITDDNLQKVKSFFESIGIVPRSRDGYYYPYSNQAISICNALLLTATLKGVSIIYDTFVEDIEKRENHFFVKTAKETYVCDKVIISIGGMSYPKTGSDGYFYKILERMGHTIIKPLPALVQLNSSGSFLKNWSGIRVDASLKLYEDNVFLKEELGELLLTNYGVSGICVMQLSSLVTTLIDLGKSVELVINFLPKFCKGRNDFIKFLDERSKLLPDRNISELLDTFFSYKLVNILIRYSNIAINKKWNNLLLKEKEALAKSFVEFHLPICGTASFNSAQVTRGGVSLLDIDLRTMESKIVKNLYITGEVLDVNGDCGGYNLTFAWISGILAGSACK